MAINHNTIKRLISFVHNLEEKLSSVKTIHEKLQELMTMVSTTHETIVDELSNVKTVLNEITIDQENNQIIPTNGIKCQWDNQQDKENETKKLNENIRRKPSPLGDRNNDSRQLSTSENHRNLKKSDQSSRMRLSKSVSFSVDKNILNQRLAKETKNDISDEITIPILSSSSSSDLLKSNQCETTPIIGKILTNIRIHEIEPKNGDYLRLLNVSNSDDYDLSGHFLQQNTVFKPLSRFRFPSNTIIRAGQTVTVWCGHLKDITPQPPHVFLWKEQNKWETGPECLTILSKPNGQSIAWFRNSLLDTDQSSSDVLLVQSKSNMGLSDVSNTSSSSLRSSLRLSGRYSRLSAFSSFGNNRSPFAHSPNSPIHPDHNGTTINTSNDLRSQINQRVGLSQTHYRSRSSPHGSHAHVKQDINSMNVSRTEQKQTTVKS